MALGTIAVSAVTGVSGCASRRHAPARTVEPTPQNRPDLAEEAARWRAEEIEWKARAREVEPAPPAPPTRTRADQIVDELCYAAEDIITALDAIEEERAIEKETGVVSASVLHDAGRMLVRARRDFAAGLEAYEAETGEPLDAIAACAAWARARVRAGH